MKIASFRKHAFSFATLFVAIIMLAACSKDKNPADPRAGYPKEVTIQYKATSPSGLTDYYHISYTNSTGGEDDLWEGKLPFTKEVKKKVEWAESLYLYCSGEGAGTVKVEIYVDGKLVATQSATSNSDPSVSANHHFE